MASALGTRIERERFAPGESVLWLAESYDGRRVHVPAMAPLIFLVVGFGLKEFWAQVASLAVAAALFVFPNWIHKSKRLYFIITDRRFLVLNGYLKVLRTRALTDIEIERVGAEAAIIRERDGEYMTKWFCFCEQDELKALRDRSDELHVRISEKDYLANSLISG